MIFFRNFFPVSISPREFSSSSSIIFRVSSQMSRSLINMELFFVEDDRYVSVFILLHPTIQFVEYIQHHLLNILNQYVMVKYFLQCYYYPDIKTTQKPKNKRKRLKKESYRPISFMSIDAKFSIKYVCLSLNLELMEPSRLDGV